MIELEDNVGDIVGKAQRGLEISDSELATKAGVSADTVRKARDGQGDEGTLRALLGLTETPDADAADALAIGLTHVRAQETARMGIPGATQI